MADDCKQPMELPPGTKTTVTGRGSTAGEAFDQALKSAEFWAQLELQKFFAGGCPPSCPILLSWQQASVKLSKEAREVTDADGKHYEHDGEVVVRAWRVCFPEIFVIPIVELEWGKARVAEEGSGEYACGANEWPVDFQEVGPEKSSPEEAEKAAIELVTRLCREKVRELVSRTRCPPDCRFRLVVPGAFLVEAVGRFHDPPKETWTAMARGRFKVRVYCIEARAVRRLIQHLKRGGYLTEREAETLILPD